MDGIILCDFSELLACDNVFFFFSLMTKFSTSFGGISSNLV